jgi:protease-4
MLFQRNHSWLLFALTPLLIAGPARAADDPPAAPVVAHIKISGSLEEAPAPADPLFGGALENFKAKLDRLRKARKDAAVKAIYLQIDEPRLGWGKLDELTREIAQCRQAGKKVFAYLEAGSPSDYYLALACDEICLPEAGWLMVAGIRAEMTFFKELFDKIGVEADFLQMGDYKAAAEPFTRTKMSEANRRQMEALIDDIYEHGIVERIVKGRPQKNWTAEQVKKLIDKGPFTAKKAMELGLVDRVDYPEGFEQSFKTAMKVEDVKVVKNYAKAKSEELDLSNPFALFKLLAPAKSVSSIKPKVAVIYATGAIVTGKGGASLLGGESCGSTTMVEAIRQAENDRTVKAIVLRIDSPGGSALASDLIWNELKRSKKPVFASMSDVAASGGYYISMAAQKIYAEPGTLTGSIGVIGGKLALKGVFDKVGITTDTITRGANAGILSSTEPFSKTQREAMTAMMRDVYDQFLDKALEGRKKAGVEMTREQLVKLAGGRVWTGRQALGHKLIDELGTLDDAIAAAWKAAGQPADKDPELLILPKSKGILDTLMDAASGDTKMQLPAAAALLKQFPELARKLQAVAPLLELRGEPVWMALPFHIEIR